MSLAKGRVPRATAGNRLTRLLNDEDDEDEFYSTTYGGFKDADEDGDYRQEREEDDIVDSDFDIDEDDEPASGPDDDDGKPKRSRRLVTRAYKEPLQKKRKIVRALRKRVRSKSNEKADEVAPDPDEPRRTRRQTLSTAKSPSPGPSSGKKRSKRQPSPSTSEPEASVESESDDSAKAPSPQKRGRKRKISESELPQYEPVAYDPHPISTPKSKKPVEPRATAAGSPEKKRTRLAERTEVKQVRSSTKVKSQETTQRVKARQKIQARRRVHLQESRVEYEMPTQEELLEETKLTELINMESLEKFHLMEIEKKKAKPVRSLVFGPRVSYRSVVMPNLGGKAVKKTPLIEMLEDGQEKSSAPPLPPLPKLNDEVGSDTDVYERTFVSFSDAQLFKESFAAMRKPKAKSRRKCTLTNIEARYFDPILKAPYYNIDVFRVLRAAYNRILYRRGDRRNRQVRTYCEWLEVEYPHMFNRAMLKKLTEASEARISKRKGLGKRIGKKSEGSKISNTADMDVDVEIKSEISIPSNSGSENKPGSSSTHKKQPASHQVIASTSSELVAEEAVKKREHVSAAPVVKARTFEHLSTLRSKSPLDYNSSDDDRFFPNRSKFIPPASRFNIIRKVSRPNPFPSLTTTPSVATASKLASQRPKSPPRIINLTPSAPVLTVKTYPAKATVAGSSTPGSTTNTTTITLNAVNTVRNITTPATLLATTAAPLQRPILIAKRSMDPLAVSGGTTIVQNVSNLAGASPGMRGTPIVIRASNASQLQHVQMAGGLNTTSSVLAFSTGTTASGSGTFQVGNSPLTLVNIGRDGVPTVIRAGGVGGLNQIGNNQVVRLLQSQKIQILQQPSVPSTMTAMTNNQIQSQGFTQGAVTTVRLPITAIQGQNSHNPPSQTATASALVAAAAANTASAVRLAQARAVGAMSVNSRLPTSTVLARSGPIAATGINTTPRLMKPITTSLRPSGAGGGVRTITASQLRSVLSSGQAMVRTSTMAGIVTTNSGIRTVSTITPGVRAFTVQGQRAMGITTMASAMLRPVTITTAGMRPLNPTSTASGVGSPIRLNPSVGQGQVSSGTPRLITLPMIRTAGTPTSSSVNPGAIRLARRPLNVGGTGSPTGTLVMPILRQSTPQAQQVSTGISLPNVITVASSSSPSQSHTSASTTTVTIMPGLGDAASPIAIPTLVQPQAKPQQQIPKTE